MRRIRDTNQPRQSGTGVPFTLAPFLFKVAPDKTTRTKKEPEPDPGDGNASVSELRKRADGFRRGHA